MNDEQSRVHRETWQLIPWLVNDSASGPDRERGEMHLLACADCRDEFAMQLRLRAAMEEAPEPAQASSDAFARLLARIDAESAPAASNARPPVVPTASRAERWLPGLLAAVVVQAIGLVALAAFAIQHRPPVAPRSGEPEPRYETLSAALPAPAAAIRLVPSSEVTLGTLQALLVAHGLRIVEANADGTILALAPTRGIDVEATVVQLRARSEVLLAEPIAALPDAR